MDVGTVIGIVGGIAAILFGYAAFARNKSADSEAEGKKDGQILTELGYIKGSIDDVKMSQRESAKQHVEIVARVTAVEASAKQAHHRIDRLERRDNNE